MAIKSRGLTIAHLNIRGLLNKIDNIRYLLDTHKIKVFHVSETFLTQSIDTQLLHIPNYYIVRRDRTGKLGGGVVSYIHSSIKFSRLFDLDSTLPESLTIKINQPHSKPFITSAVYRPPNSPSTWNDQFSTYLQECRALNNELIILGDFNINLNSPNNKWDNLMRQHSLLQLINQPTRIQKNSQSLIDHVYVTDLAKISHSDVLKIGVSDHFLMRAPHPHQTILSIIRSFTMTGEISHQQTSNKT